MTLRGAPVAAVRSLKAKRLSRTQLLRWLDDQGLRGVAELSDVNDHVVAACAAALAAWHWSLGRPAWRCEAAPPMHPYDFAC
jgi:hypothetical protein